MQKLFMPLERKKSGQGARAGTGKIKFTFDPCTTSCCLGKKQNTPSHKGIRQLYGMNRLGRLFCTLKT